MIALAVDDEVLMLKNLVRAVEKSPDIDQIAAFHSCVDALNWAQTHRPQIAFLDIQLRTMNGIELAEELLKLHPQLAIVFCTAFSEYAVSAFQIHASGYLLKPVFAEDVQREIDHIKGRTGTKKLLRMNCFGTFDVFDMDGHPLHFRRKKAKELLAFLVDRNGSGVTAREICTRIWPDSPDEKKSLNYLQKLSSELAAALATVNAGEVFQRKGGFYSVDRSLVLCDYFCWRDGDRSNEHRFLGEYMTQYAWATATCLQLQRNRI